ncbi:hypothetical protein PIB30_014336 [Stylosanthes scabra]|uniref:Uncharacterized protein n=1 Tax=Stylosanthes scabra TaxID=79078 RepID=A0ABU6R6Y8_9FABA|nr:hypothetical protein [Stylosanthes scabra]
MLQIHMGGSYDQPHLSHVFHPQVSTPDIDFAPENYTQCVADMIGQSSYQPPPDVPYWGTPVQHTEPFSHMSAETPPTAYAPRRQDPSESSSSGEQQIRAQVSGRLGRGRRETCPPPCGTGGCPDPRVTRRGRGRGPQ